MATIKTYSLPSRKLTEDEHKYTQRLKLEGWIKSEFLALVSKSNPKKHTANMYLRWIVVCDCFLIWTSAMLLLMMTAKINEGLLHFEFIADIHFGLILARMLCIFNWNKAMAILPHDEITHWRTMFLALPHSGLTRLLIGGMIGFITIILLLRQSWLLVIIYIYSIIQQKKISKMAKKYLKVTVNSLKQRM